ncbi:hypothetical protein COCNU_11G006850 [Cocos nucifera]|uniref:RRM domain-containing protein n=1 Tax=Cocos nucifera TaxID=13894 RepID=A0A8K0IPV7_COCNU|nr:hypothetical protein COCNU_11G006850 [Cocos nucifera]
MLAEGGIRKEFGFWRNPTEGKVRKKFGFWRSSTEGGIRLLHSIEGKIRKEFGFCRHPTKGKIRKKFDSCRSPSEEEIRKEFDFWKNLTEGEIRKESCSCRNPTEYVIVLLRNGRRKDEARKELNVFLGDDSVTFISWLWDHLSSNLHLYVQPQESFPDEMVRTSSISNQLPGRHISQVGHQTGNVQADSEHERERLTKVSRSQHDREWKGLVRGDTQVFPLRSVVTDILHSEEKTHRRSNLARRSRSPKPQVHKKRSREDEEQPNKRGSTSQPAIGAPRRLLQFAVRDAVRTVQQSISKTEPTSKRLRSVVSTSTTDSVQEKRPQRTKSVARVPGALSTALKAAAEAAEDVKKVRSSSSVFDRLGQGIDTVEPINQASNFRAPELEDGEYEHFDQIPALNHVHYHERSDYNRDFVGDMTMADKVTGMDDDYASDNGEYAKVGIVTHHGSDASQSASSAHKDKKSRMEYSVAKKADDVVRKTRVMDQDPPASSAAMTSSKILNISVNVNTWKPPHYQDPMDVAEADNRMIVEKSEMNVAKPNDRLPKENDAAKSEKIKEMEHADVQEEPQRTTSATGSYAAGLPSDDVDSRTLFVHFAATKDTLSRHFNKFGAVLKVIIVTDGATGQPTGSAYVEFLKKESAESALSLNGTSFMSRILKVVRRRSHEAAPMLGWPRIARGSLFASRLGRIPYPRGAIGGAFRARLPVKPGARSLQWKRGASTAQPRGSMKDPPSSSLGSGNNVLSPTGRSLTYNRAEPKADGNTGPA